jgi:hypothetical protein
MNILNTQKTKEKKMRFLILFTITTLLSFQALALDSSSELLKRASKNRIELQTVILEIEQNLKVLSDPVVFRKYFEIIPQLADLAISLDLEQIHPQAVQKLANDMAAHGSRWLKLSSDDKDLILDHVKWMDATATFRFLQYQQDLVNKLKTDEEYYKFVENLNHILVLIEGKFVTEWYIEQGYKDLSSEVAFQRLNSLNFDTSFEHIKWMSFLKNLDSSTAYANSLYRQSLNLSPENEDEGLVLLTIATAFSEYIEGKPFRLSERIESPISSVKLEIIDNAFVGSWESDLPALLAAIRSLTVEGLSFLADRWSSSVTRITSDQDPTVFISLITELSAQLNNAGLSLRAEALKQNSLPRLSFIKLANSNAEGVYTVKTKKGAKHTFTLIKSSDQGFIVALATTTSFKITRTFFYVTYNSEKDSYTAFQTISGLGSSDANDFMEFKISEDGVASVYSSSYFGSEVATGKVSVGFNEQFAKPANINIADGTYVGKFRSPNGRSKKIRLVLGSLENRAFAKLSLGEHVDVDFNYGSLLDTGYLHLTSSKLDSGSAVHLRLASTEQGKLEGIYIITGRDEFSKITLSLEE